MPIGQPTLMPMVPVKSSTPSQSCPHRPVKGKLQSTKAKQTTTSAITNPYLGQTSNEFTDANCSACILTATVLLQLVAEAVLRCIVEVHQGAGPCNLFIEPCIYLLDLSSHRNVMSAAWQA